MTEATITRRLGTDGPEVSAIGFGAWAIGGPASRDGRPIGWGEVDDDESVAALHAALDAGVTLIDTANVYGAGHSERVVARALQGRRDEVVIATKFGNLIDEAKREAIGRDASPESIREQCDASLSRLRTDVIDLYQFHIGDYPLDRAGEVRDALEGLVADGKIRFYGWSTDDPDRAAFFAEGEHCAAVQQSFSLVNGNEDTLAVAERHGLASIVRGPLAMGLLTGKMTRETTFAETDVRHGWDWSGDPGRRLDALDKVREILTEDGRTLAQGALGWLLARSEAFVPIPGIRTVAQARDNAGVLAAGPLSADQLDRIAAALA
ncbi:aldo/keto reductase [Microlunatus parietis]|uniref:Aryl-alcohol dehydrogenase-like predicted oxidoreductase n=1 Tax=Microlunatus parietis TaxID=682979 RepID=A0A7Y9LEK7_9ACTN|nr:aldo/keto reductase [Microlunatus parietis]NYE75077.1 aryl-alcohol dehydrogenase-like predicted oxidoreductase [Microlunatus parietis]